MCTFALAFRAQMAESVDALVSNTSGATRPGSTPGLGTKLESEFPANICLQGFFYCKLCISNAVIQKTAELKFI